MSEPLSQAAHVRRVREMQARAQTARAVLLDLAQLCQVLGQAQDADLRHCSLGLLRHQYGAGWKVVAAGSDFDGLYAVHSGMLKITGPGSDGPDTVLGIAGRGALLGKDGVDNGRHGYSLVALSDCELITVPKAAADAGLGAEPLGRVLDAALGREQNRSGQWFIDGMRDFPLRRMARLMCWIAEQHMAGPALTELAIPMSRGDLASLLVLRPSVLSEVLTTMMQIGTLLVSCRIIKIVDPVALASMAGKGEPVHRSRSHASGSKERLGLACYS